MYTLILAVLCGHGLFEVPKTFSTYEVVLTRCVNVARSDDGIFTTARAFLVEMNGAVGTPSTFDINCTCKHAGKVYQNTLQDLEM